MTSPVRVLAVDLGASSVRVAAVDLGRQDPSVDVIHRWHHAPTLRSDGSLRWDWPQLLAEVERGLEGGMAAGAVASIGVDGWGVDYGLLDRDGELVGDPHSYRDTRTNGWEETSEAIGVEHLYHVTGIQRMAFNTVFQLAAHDRAELARANRLLLLPDLVVRHLGGRHGAERSNVSTTGLMDVTTGDWAGDLIDHLSLDRSLFPAVVAACQTVGSWRGVPVTLVGSHDTASAFLGMPNGSEAGTVFVSTGSWIIVGVERTAPDTSRAAREANFSNEAGALGGFRFLKNVVGFSILERCRAAWGGLPIEVLIEEASTVDEAVPTFDAMDHRFVNPPDMEGEIRAATGLAATAPRAVVVRSVLESIVGGIAAVIDQLSSITGDRMERIALVGGGAAVRLLHAVLSERTGLPVIRGSPEATALGNALVQGIALGLFPDIHSARQWVGRTGERV